MHQFDQFKQDMEKLNRNEEGNWERVDDEAYWMPIEPPKEGV